MKTNNISEITLERYLLNQLPADQSKYVSAALETEPQLKQRLQQMQQENLLLLEQYPVSAYREPILRHVMAPIPEKSRQKNSRFALLTATGAVMAMLLVTVGLWVIPSRSPAPQVRPKGALPSAHNCRMHLFRQQNQHLQPLFDGARVKPGERLQLAYSARVPSHGVLLSFDGRRQIILHFPEQHDGTTLLSRGRQLPLPNSYELDLVADFERFVFITSTEKIAVSDVLQHIGEIIGAAKQPAKAPLSFPAPLQVQTILLYKERQP